MIKKQQCGKTSTKKFSLTPKKVRRGGRPPVPRSGRIPKKGPEETRRISAKNAKMPKLVKSIRQSTEEESPLDLLISRLYQ